MQISKYTRRTERFVRLKTGPLFIILLASCAAPSQVWDPLEPSSNKISTGLDRATVKLSPSMAALIQQADDKIKINAWPDALAILERALRINPKQAEAWTRMAVVYLGMSQPERALSMAQKSNSLAAKNNSLKAYNWTLISRAYRQMSQPEQAREAESKSRYFQQGMN